MFEQQFFSDPYASKNYPTALAEPNLKLNRYLNTLPLEHHRVKLPLADTSDYINASHTELGGVGYISCQAPLKDSDSIYRFWLMVLSEHISTIAMLTGLEEDGKTKADQYWPDSLNKPLKAGGITVCLLREQTIPGDIVIRRFQVSIDHTMNKKLTHPVPHTAEVAQVHFTGWRDLEVPDGTAIADLIGTVDTYHGRLSRQKAHKGATPLIAVHCSAGVGRTGTFIVAREIMRHTRHQGKNPPPQFVVTDAVSHLRAQRHPTMVQTESQFVFCHLFLREYKKMHQRRWSISSVSDVSRGELGGCWTADAADGTAVPELIEEEDE